MYGYYKRQPAKSRSRLSSKRIASRETKLLRNGRSQDTEPLLLNRRGAAKDIQDMPLMYDVDCIVRGLRKRLKDIPLAIRVVLASLALYALSSVLNMLIQVVILSMNWVYTILGIVASIIVAYEFFIKRQQKKSR